MNTAMPPQSLAHAPGRRAARMLTVTAVVLAVLGLAGLVAVLVTAAVGGTVWPGFVAMAYICLPVAFLLLGVALLVGVLERRRPSQPRR